MTIFIQVTDGGLIAFQDAGGNNTNTSKLGTVSITKGIGTTCALSIIGLDYSGDLAHIYTPGNQYPVVYINDAGHFYSKMSLNMSGHSSGQSILKPSGDPSMLAVWSDVTGPAVQIRTNIGAAEERILDGMDYNGNYVFSIGPEGELRWGASTYDAQDTFLSRNASGTLQIGNGINANGTLKCAMTQAGVIYNAATNPLPVATTGLTGTRAVVNDATMPSYLGAYVSGGTVTAPVFCNGTQWVIC